MSWRDRTWNHDQGGPRRRWGGFNTENPMAWAPSIGSVFGIRIKLHIIFLIYLAVELLRSASEGGFWFSLRYLVILFGLVFLHEMGHCFGARRVGGDANEVLMWPLGGLAMVSVPHNPRAHLISAAAGPFVNFAFCMISAMILSLAAGSLRAVPWNPFNAYPSEAALPLLVGSTVFLLLYQFFYVNYVLLLFNVVLPLFPLDGGRIWQAILWYRLGYSRSMQIASTAGMIGAVLLGVFGLFNQNLMLVGVAVFAYLTSMQYRKAVVADPEWAEVPHDVNASADQADAPDRRRGLFGKGLWERKRKKIAAEDAEVDRILAKVHDQGIQSLSRSEKKTLERATRRQQGTDRRAGRVDRL
ncbi:MAG TPA: M50 family metallopeptidase [Phycisphaerae bacterium]|nr:M50 family metallopeptidase [Phycisphaerae bacterium]HRY67333.1 M50 family metallopeptidase [Phycisphaerae bacterium]HSA28476.1 M50 family metallopeptidase [Phycisphaerae bacterium]